MKVLITGSAGFVGRHLTKACLRRGWEVEGLDLANSRDCMSFFLGDRLYAYQKSYDLVLHCAAFVNGRAGIDGRPAGLHAYNTMLDAALFHWALQLRPGRVVYFSSSAAYPAELQTSWNDRPLLEKDIYLDSISAPEASYGRAKLHGEQMAADTRAAGVPVTVLRPFSGYGRDQSMDYPFPRFVARAKGREDPFEVWGSGEQVRDWIHIDDIVEATLRAVTEGIDGPVNLCTGVGTSFLELASLVTKLAGYEPVVKLREDKPAGVDYRVGDPTKLHEFYTPQVGLIEGVTRALA